MTLRAGLAVATTRSAGRPFGAALTVAACAILPLVTGAQTTAISMTFKVPAGWSQASPIVPGQVYFIRDGEDFLIQMNDDELPQLRLNAQYRKMLDRDQGATKHHLQIQLALGPLAHVR